MQTLAALMWVAVCLCVVGSGQSHVNANDAIQPKEITEIIVERKGGPAPPAKGNVHLRRGDQPAYEFDRLVTWLVRKRFFDLKERYEPDNKPLDADFIVLTVVRGESRKTVINYAGEGDAETWEFEMMIRGVAADLLNRYGDAEK